MVNEGVIGLYAELQSWLGDEVGFQWAILGEWLGVWSCGMRDGGGGGQVCCARQVWVHVPSQKGPWSTRRTGSEAPRSVAVR